MPLLRTAGARHCCDVTRVKHHIEMGASRGRRGGFPGGPVGESTCQCRSLESSPGPRRPHMLQISHARAPQPLNPCAAATEAHALQQEWPPQGEASTLQWRGAPPHQAQLEKTHSEDPAKPKKRIKINKVQRAKGKSGWQSLETTEGYEKGSWLEITKRIDCGTRDPKDIRTHTFAWLDNGFIPEVTIQ